MTQAAGEMLAGSGRVRVAAVRALVRLDLWTALTTMTPYAVVALVAAISAFILKNSLTRIEEDGLLILVEPFGVPLYAGVLIVSLYLAASAALAVSREREQGAVELLVYGPVDSRAYMTAKFLTYLLLYVWLAALIVFCYLLLSFVTGLRLHVRIGAALVLSVATASAATSLGLAVAALIRRLRPTMLVVFGLMVFAVGVQIANETLARLPTPEFHVSPVQVLRIAAGGLATVSGWLLPFGYLDRGVGALLRGDIAAYLATAAASWLYALALLWTAWVGLEKTGIRR